MLQERRNKIIELLHEDGIVKVSELMRLFDVSIETVRRDLEYMEEHGMLNRVYGGAVPAQPRATEPSYSTREIKHFKEKKAIGEKAVELVRDEDVIAVDIGTTTLEFAKALVGKRRVTVITNSMKIAMILSEDINIRVIMLGGEVRSGEASVSGYMTDDNVSHFITDKYFLGVGGLSLTKGITDYHMAESNHRRIVIANTQKVIALADHSKMGALQ
ncbi:hypothetical protein HMPREF9469_03271 [ [[Clostridium] citroniae WAL-17108]|uniref:HTH deoR-type domain-containing protein n=1 Tax=[Clostridium] citroniae WAL-17108 TaxID=742733 RepID=G5HL43_9FIRM|nr:DeoR/GlpR family DNA-binding transcription regulator [Enterocloster citroniae]EHE97938.1 hypothetical protein HMPREF9469_03271 [ [[Clostridium] citroniae WAL-17108]